MRPFDGRQPLPGAAKAAHADLIALPQGDEGDEQHGIQAVVKLAERAVERPHAAAAVRHEQHGLITHLVEIAADEAESAAGGLPVHLGKHVAILIVAQLMEIERGPDAAAANDAHLLDAIGHRQQGEAHDGLIIGIGAGLLGLANEVEPLPEAEH